MDASPYEQNPNQIARFDLGQCDLVVLIIAQRFIRLIIVCIYLSGITVYILDQGTIEKKERLSVLIIGFNFFNYKVHKPCSVHIVIG